ncbi:hypothetical protein H4J59_08030 [Colwellia sp. MB02u-10]|uniref:hypothetical protein n=1 Tax=Colwellia sp. MB02u-10 TaxID=2759828 RepID=UPI0015F76B52|nr:hypothetical protein [Colwellia sp. MB02u-10]MBA6340935.1 hypothetical protein [Colwellia sp. MB02u-10]
MAKIYRGKLRWFCHPVCGAMDVKIIAQIIKTQNNQNIYFKNPTGRMGKIKRYFS